MSEEDLILMSDQVPKEKIDYLVDVLNNYTLRYNQEFISEIGDIEYDTLFEELKDLENKYPEFLRSDSPTQNIGLVPSGSSVPHYTKMYSLENVFTKEALNKWAAKFTPGTILFADLKHDGMSIELIYENGKLVRAITRGDGVHGEDVTANIYRVNESLQGSGILLELDEGSYPHDTMLSSILGELTLPYSSLAKINERQLALGKNLYSNPRNAVSGIIRSHRPEEYLLNFIEFDPWGGDPKLLDVFEDITAVTNEFSRFYDNGTERECVDATNTDLQPIFDFYDKYNALYRDFKSFDHPIDGIVIKVADTKLWSEIGYTKHHPKFAVAFKFTETIKTTTIKDIVYQIGKVGSITPVAVLEPVEVGSVLISSVNLHNIKYIIDHMYFPGATVEVYRAGGVIPALGLCLNLEHAKDYNQPTECIFCHQPLDLFGARLRCTNVRCEGIVIARLTFAVSKACLDITGLSTKTVEKFVQQHHIKDIFDLLTLTLQTIELSVDRSIARTVYRQLQQIIRCCSINDPVTVKRLILGLSVPNLTILNINKLLGNEPLLHQEWRQSLVYLLDIPFLRSIGISKTAAVSIEDNVRQRAEELKKVFNL